MTKRKVEQLENREAGAKTYIFVRDLTCATMTQATEATGSQVEALAIGISAVAGALHGVAAICGQREGIDSNSSPEDQESTVNDTSVLVAALLAAKATHESREYLALQLNPIVYLAVVKAAEILLGQNVDAELNPNLIDAARRWEKENGYFGGWKDQTARDPKSGLLN